jgi:plasmid stabilization system protein ParE
MNISATKIELVKDLLDTNSEVVLKHIKAILKRYKTDLWDDLTENQKQSVKKAKKQLEKIREMDFKIIWSPEAEETFETIISYLEREIKKFIVETEKTVFLLTQNPFLFRGSEKENVYEALVGKQNLLLYQISETSGKVELLSFWDTRQDPNSKFNK